MLKVLSVVSLVAMAPLMHVQAAQSQNVTIDKHSDQSLLELAMNKFKIKVSGLIHVGASKANMAESYKEFKNVIWIEANPTVAAEFEKDLSKLANIKVFSFALSDHNGENVLINKMEVKNKKLDDFLKDISNKDMFNVIVIDVDGAELAALKGAKETLKQIDFIIAEVNYLSRNNKVLVTDLDEFLAKNEFVRVDTKSKSYVHGHALYIKKGKIS